MAGGLGRCLRGLGEEAVGGVSVLAVGLGLALVVLDRGERRGVLAGVLDLVFSQDGLAFAGLLRQVWGASKNTVLTTLLFQ